jgi:hypothetical protein
MPHVKVVASAQKHAGESLVFPARADFLAALSKLEPGDYTVIVMQPGDQRSSQANRRYWGLLIRAFCEHTGYTPYEAHELCKAQFLAARAGACDHVEAQIIGNVSIGESTTDLCTSCFSLYSDDVEMWLGSEFGITPKESRVA